MHWSLSPEMLDGRVSQIRVGLTGLYRDAAEADTTVGAMDTVREPPPGVVEPHCSLESPTAMHWVVDPQETPSSWFVVPDPVAPPSGAATWLQELPFHSMMKEPVVGVEDPGVPVASDPTAKQDADVGQLRAKTPAPEKLGTEPTVQEVPFQVSARVE